MDLLFFSAISIKPNTGGYNDDKKRCAIARSIQVEGPNGGVEHQDNHAVQLHPFQQHPGEHRQEEEVEHHRDKRAATL